MNKRRLVRIGAALTAALLLGVFGYALFVSRSGGGLERRLKQIRASGAPATIAELAPTNPLPPDENAAVWLERAAAGAAAINRRIEPVYEDKDYQAGRATAELETAIQKALETSPESLDLVRRAGDCAAYQSPLDFSLGSAAVIEQSIENTGKFRNALRVLVMSARLAEMRNQPDEALADSVRVLRLGRLFESEPTLVAYLVSLAARGIGAESANRALRLGGASREARRRLVNELDRHDLAAAFPKAIQSERPVNLESSTGNSVLMRLMMVRQRHEILDLHEDYLQALDGGGLAAPNVKRATPPASQLLAMFEAARRATLRTQALLRCLRIVNAAADSPAIAPDLSELKLPQLQLLDPFTGEPLRITTAANGWTVYSVGEDRQDNRGSVDDGRDAGLGPAGP